MMVTADVTSLPAVELDDEWRRSIEIAVAQHLRNRTGIDIARRALRTLGVSDDEIVRRRRAESADDDLAKLLRLAVTIVITRGRLSESERRNASRWFSEARWAAIVETTTKAYATVIRTETRLVRPNEPDLDLEVGDY